MSDPEMMVRVLMVDDHALVRAGLRLLLESHTCYRVVGEAGDRAAALSLAARERPDVILLDLDLGGENAIDFLKELQNTAEAARILVLTGLRDPDLHRRAIRLGARGVLVKEKAAESLIMAVKKVHQGELWVDRGLAADLIADMQAAEGGRSRDPERGKIDSLTARERDVVALIAQGLKNKDIADRLFVSDTTVRHHLTSIFSKLDVPDRLALVIYAFRHRLAAPPR